MTTIQFSKSLTLSGAGTQTYTVKINAVTVEENLNKNVINYQLVRQRASGSEPDANTAVSKGKDLDQVMRVFTIGGEIDCTCSELVYVDSSVTPKTRVPRTAIEVRDMLIMMHLSPGLIKFNYGVLSDRTGSFISGYTPKTNPVFGYYQSKGFDVLFTKCVIVENNSGDKGFGRLSANPLITENPAYDFLVSTGSNTFNQSKGVTESANWNSTEPLKSKYGIYNLPSSYTVNIECVVISNEWA